jgi:FimV-like protein
VEADGESAGIERAREKIREAREKALGKEASKQNRKSAEEAGGDEAAAAEEAEQKKRLEQEKARKEAEEKARLEAEAKRKAEEQKKKAELERKKRQEEKRKAEQEKRKAEERKKAEAERRKAQEARKKAEEERARKQEEKRKKKQREKERTEWLESLAKDLLMAPENAIDQGNRSPASKQEHDWKSSLPADYQALLGDSPGAEKPAPGADEAVDRVNAASASLRIARNYVDMGEAELAGRLLHDVLQTGNSSQQAAAKALLEKIKQ